MSMPQKKNSTVCARSCFSKNNNVVCRRIADAVVLVPVHKSAVELEALFTLNDTAALIWESLDGKKNCREIAAILAEQWQVPQDQCLADVLELVKELRVLGFLQEERS